MATSPLFLTAVIAYRQYLLTGTNGLSEAQVDLGVPLVSLGSREDIVKIRILSKHLQLSMYAADLVYCARRLLNTVNGKKADSLSTQLEIEVFETTHRAISKTIAEMDIPWDTKTKIMQERLLIDEYICKLRSKLH